MKHWKRKAFSCTFGFFIIDSAVAETLLLEPNIQGYSTGDIIHAINNNGKYFLEIQDLSESLKFKFDEKSGTGKFLDKKFKINSKKLLSKDFINLENRKYYSTDFYEKILPIEMDINSLEMQLNVNSEYILPTTRKNKNHTRQKSDTMDLAYDPFDNYEFDERYFSFPLVDFIYRRNENISRLGLDNERHIYGDYYQLNSGLLFAGLDTLVTIFGDNYGASDLTDTKARVTFGRTFLEEPRNDINLKKFAAGDIIGITNGLFHNSANGRGVMASSFKDLVISADKKIDITGAMQGGWEAELYLNNQLIGFRHGSIDGRYEFRGIPVNYGLNDFSVVLYGPFGEVRTEEKRYYSGTSPVKSGEFGYNIDAYQKNRFLFESNEPYVSSSDSITADSLFYYGIGDYLTLISGATNVESVTEKNKDLQFGTAGLQLALNGVSAQYNTTYNFDNEKVGHHFDAQGNIYIGDIFARYEYYGDTNSPISFVGNGYLKDLFEGRLTGWIPGINMPYYISYSESNNHNDKKFQEAHARLSPNFMRYYNFSIENIWLKSDILTTNYIDAMLQATYGNFRTNARASYQTDPTQYLKNYGAFVEYRWDRNTFFQVTWDHDCRSKYTNMDDIDLFNVGASRLFSFGGIGITVGTDTDRNLSFGLTYNISLGKNPNSYKPFINSETQMANYGTIYARVRDESGAGVPDVNLIASGREAPIKTDKNGDALITNLESYQKTSLTVDEESIGDISLVPEFTNKKLVLRPGALRTVDIPFKRMGGMEGQLSNTKQNKSYQVFVIDKNKTIIATKIADDDGSFIFDGIPYGNYTLEITDENDRVLNKTGIIINQSFFSMTTPIGI